MIIKATMGATDFDTQIKPILLYACEAWADSMKANIDDVTLN